MRVLVYSPVRLFGEGLAAFLESIGSVGAVRVEHNVKDLESTVGDFGADVALIDVMAPDGLPAARLVRALCPEVATVAVAVAETAEEVIACADAGFAAYIPRNASVPEMLAIIDHTYQGGTVCDPRIARSLFDELARRKPMRAPFGPDDCLTRREIEIAKLLSRGSANKEIAEELHLSVATIKNHVHSVLHKLQVNRRSQVANLLVENPWILRVP
jgi:two-component system nitrate/nitrite response regulator NarL